MNPIHRSDLGFISAWRYQTDLVCDIAAVCKTTSLRQLSILLDLTPLNVQLIERAARNAVPPIQDLS